MAAVTSHENALYATGQVEALEVAEALGEN